MARGRRSDGPPLPDGIEARHLERRSGFPLSLLSLVVLGGIAAWGISGFAGSQPVTVTQAGPAATLRVQSPDRIRNGEVFESRIDVTAHRPIGRLVIAVTPQLWRHITMNSMTPAPGDESFEDDTFRFGYGEVASGDRFEVKLDFQINPTLGGRNEGRVSVFDGRERLAEVAVAMRVLP